MKNGLFAFGLMMMFVFFSESISAQTTQASFAGSWKMKPLSSSHNLSKLNIFDNGTSVTITIKYNRIEGAPTTGKLFVRCKDSTMPPWVFYLQGS